MNFKAIHLLTWAVIGLTSSVFAQKPSVYPLQQIAPTIASPGQLISPSAMNAGYAAGPMIFQQSETNVIFYEDFANGFAGNNGVGAWSAEDTGGGQIWQHVDAEGNGFYADGTASGVQPPAGEYSTNIGSLNSTTADNGWMVFDNDYFNTPVSDGYENTEGWITTPTLDMANNGSVVVSWEQYFRYCCHPYAPIYLEVSNDAGLTWTTFDAHGTFIESANSASANALTTSVDISCVAAYAAEVQIRWSYLQAPETGDAYSHYYWGIDDVTISENPVADDLTMVQVTNGDVYNVFEYRVTPLEQAIPEADGGLLAGVLYRNAGNANQDETVITVEILDDSGTVLSTTTQNIGTVLSFANATNCPANEQDTVYIATGWAPSDVGNYVVQATIGSANEDATPEDNIMSKVIIYSDDEYGHDDEGDLDVEFAPGESDIAGLFNPCGYGNYYHMHNEGSVAYGIAVRFGPNAGGGNLDFESRLYTLDGAVGLTDSPFESAYWTYDDQWTPNTLGNTEIVVLPFANPIELSNTDFYFAAVISEFESEAQLTVAGNSNSDTDGSTGDYSFTGAGDLVWFASQSNTPAIRLVMSPINFPGCTNPQACNYIPGASEDDGSCEYDSCAGCMDEAACNFDLTATIENDTDCTFPGCSDPESSNYDSSAGCSGECIYLTYDCASIGEEAWSNEEIGLFPNWQQAMHGVGWEGEWVFNVPATVLEPQSSVSYGIHHVAWSEVDGLPDWVDSSEFTLGDLGASSQHCIAASGIPSAPGIHEITASGEVFISIFGQEFSIGEQTYSAWLEVTENPNPIPGCMYGNAVNYEAYATVDNGSCLFAGCTDENAGNFNPLATIDDGSCGEACDPENESMCTTDVNNDGFVNVSDLLLLLSEFGEVCQ